MAEINWIKLRVDMFDDDKIKIIQSMPEGDAILVVWIRILALSHFILHNPIQVLREKVLQKQSVN